MLHISDTRGIQVNADLQSPATYLSRLVDFPILLSRELEGLGQIKPLGEGCPGILVVMVDDLDRCPLELVTEVLSITQQWGKVKNLFVILAINQKVLLEALKERAPEKVMFDPDYAVTVPSLDVKHLRCYVRDLLRVYTRDDVSKAISDSATYLEMGLRYRTPRAVKRCLNKIRPGVRLIGCSMPQRRCRAKQMLRHVYRFWLISVCLRM